MLFEWNSKDLYRIIDTYAALLSLKIDYAHINSIEIDYDNNLLISSCYLNEITKIDRNNGSVIWRLGGRNNEFSFINCPVSFSFQHSVKRLKNGNLILFDNGNLNEIDYSRGLEFELDEENKIAKLVKVYTSKDKVFSTFKVSSSCLEEIFSSISFL